MLTSLNIPMPSSGAAIGEATEEEEDVVEEGGGNPEGACLPCILRVSSRGYKPVFILSRTLFYSHYG